MTQSFDNDQRRLYRDLAWTWPIISAPETYVEETERSSVFRELAPETIRSRHRSCGVRRPGQEARSCPTHDVPDIASKPKTRVRGVWGD